MRDIQLSEVTVAQSLDFDYDNQFIYVGQIIQGGRQFPDEGAPVPFGTRESNGDTSISRLNMDGTLESNMYIRGSGHGTSVGVAPDGRLWVGADSSGSGFSRAIALITYEPGALKDSDTFGTIYRPFGPASGSHGLSVSVDQRFGKMCVRRTFPDPGDGRRHYLFNLNDTMAGNFSNPLYEVDQAANQPPDTPGAIGTSQGMCTYGDYLYSLEGTPETDNCFISRLSWVTGETEQKVKMTIMADLTHREPEGLTVQNIPGSPNSNKLVFGFASGPNGGRKYNLAYIPASGA